MHNLACTPFVDGCVEVVGARGDGHNLGNPSAEQGNDGDYGNKCLHNPTPCKLPHNVEVLSRSLFMAPSPSARSNLLRISCLSVNGTCPKMARGHFALPSSQASSVLSFNLMGIQLPVYVRRRQCHTFLCFSSKYKVVSKWMVHIDPSE